MFWKFSYSTSQIQTILEKPDVTLVEILNEDDVLQECKSNNDKLITFLTQSENLNQLVSYIITLPTEDLNEASRFKHSTIACELLTCDVALITDSLMLNLELIEKLYSFLNNEPPLNPLLASYFAKVMGSLISRKTELLLNFLQSKNDFVPLLLKHINTSAIMDILLRLLTTIENNELKKRVLKWLTDINLIKYLIELFSCKYTDDVHSNVAQALCDIIRITREQIYANREAQRETTSFNTANDLGFSSSVNNLDMNNEYILTNPLLDVIEAPETINRLLELMFESVESPSSSLTHGIEVLLTILEPKTSTVEFIIDLKNLEADRLFKEQERLTIALRGIKCVSDMCVSKLNLFHEVLDKKSQLIDSINMTFGTLTPPLGVARLNVIKLISKLIATNNPKINEEIIRLGTLNKILNFTFEYKWNNFLHAQITNIITNLFALNNPTVTASLIANSTINIPNKNENDENNANNQEKVNNKNLDNQSSDNDEHKQDVEMKPVNEICTNNETECSIALLEHLFKECRLVDRLLSAWFDYFESTVFNQKNGKRSNNAGYIGHLTQITNLINKNAKEGKFAEYLQSYFSAINKEIGDQWRELEETKLLEINQRNSQDLVRNPLISSSTDSNTESELLDLPGDEHMQRKYADFNKDMTPSFAESFGISETNISSYIGKNSDGFPKLQNISFQSFQLDTNDENAQLFDQICAQRDNMRESIGESDEDLWVSREIKFAETHDDMVTKKNKIESKELNLSDDDNSSSSSSSDEENNKETTSSKTKVATTEINPSQQDTVVEEMDYTNSNEIKFNNLNNNNFNMNADDNNENKNWADFSNFKGEQVALKTVAQDHGDNLTITSTKTIIKTQIITNTSSRVITNNLSTDEDNNWANFDSFNELTNERCSSPNDTQPIAMDTVDRSKTYVFKEITDESHKTQKVNELKQESTKITTTIIEANSDANTNNLSPFTNSIEQQTTETTNFLNNNNKIEQTVKLSTTTTIKSNNLFLNLKSTNIDTNNTESINLNANTVDNTNTKIESINANSER